MVVNEGQSNCQRATNIQTTSANPTEIIETRQANMVNNEIQLGIEPGRLVNITYIELGEGERLDGRTFMEVHILHTHFNALLIEREDHGVIGAPAARLTPPLGGRPLEAWYA